LLLWIFYTQDSVHRIQHVKDPRVLDPIINSQAVLAILDQSGSAEKHELLRDVGLALPKECRQMANTLFILSQGIEDTQAGGMGNRLEEARLSAVCIHMANSDYIPIPEYSLQQQGQN
jgi:hypothetical protein